MSSPYHIDRFLRSVLFIGTIALAIVPCADGETWVEQSDAGAVWSTSQATIGIGPLSAISGTLPIDSDVDMYCVRIADRSAFRAFLLCSSSAAPDLYLFHDQGVGIALNTTCQSSQVSINGALVPANSRYRLAIAGSGAIALSGETPIWDPPAGPPRPPDYPHAHTGWGGTPVVPTSFRSYSISLVGCEPCEGPPVGVKPGSWGGLKLVYR
jgi:hypothetical protein